MSDHIDYDPISKLAKLNTSDDYILWKRRVLAYIRKYDAELLGFDLEPASNAPSVRKKWFDHMMKAKSTIILCLGDSPLVKVRTLVDDNDVTAKTLWDELEKIYNASNAQSILNIRQDMDDLRYEEGKSWKDHVNKFTELLSKLATYDEELSEKEKASKLLRTLPEPFSGFAMIAQVQDLELERLIQAMHAEMSRRTSVRNISTRNNSDTAPMAANATNSSKKASKGPVLLDESARNEPICVMYVESQDTLLETAGTNPTVMVIVGGVAGNRDLSEEIADEVVAVAVVSSTGTVTRVMISTTQAMVFRQAGMMLMVFSGVKIQLTTRTMAHKIFLRM